MKKRIPVLFIIVIMNICFCACTTSNTKVLDGSAADIMKEVRKQVYFPAMIEINSYDINGPDVLKNYYGIVNPEKLKDYSILIPQQDNYTEIAIFKIDKNKDECYDNVLQGIQRRYSNLYDACKAYNPEKLDNLRNRTLIRYENAIVFFINSQNRIDEIMNTIDRFSRYSI